MTPESSDNPPSAIRNPQSPFTDSPWFWVLSFSLFALAGLAVLVFSGWYGKRQTRLELQYQARYRVAEKITAENNPGTSKRTDDLEARRPFATPGNNLVTVWPLAVLLGIVAVVAAAMLYRGSRVAAGPGRPVESP
jgi:hypothetical protein